MLEKNLDIIYNKQFLVIVPQMSINLFDSFKYSFGNCVLMTTDVDDKLRMINFVNKNNFSKIIFVNYQLEYEEIIKSLNKKTKYDFIFTESMAEFSNEFIYSVYKNVYKLFKNNTESQLGIVDYNLYECLNKKEKNIKYIMLDNKKSEIVNSNCKNVVGILNTEDNPNHSFYNELSAIKLIDNCTANIFKCGSKTKHFLKIFKIKNMKSKNLIKTIENSEVNLYINFTSNDNNIFFKSMDMGRPCILGNSSLLDNYKILKEYLVMKSDDDIDEIAERIINVRKNKEKILKEYNKFRQEYEYKSRESIETFLNLNKKFKNEELKTSDILISVIVPVYNTSFYLEKSLKSIIKASIKNTEIIVINDGSTDNSEDIILKYQNKYPNLIRYIKQENHGLGNVRNVGLNEAKGKYIASIDSDDTIDKNFFKEAKKYLEQNVDIVIYDWLTVTNEGKYQTAAFDYIFDNEKYNRYEALLYTSIMPSTCNKIIKKELFDNLNIKYLEDKYEDLSTNPFVLLEAETIKYINKGYYEYYIRSNSIMRTKAGYSMIDVIKEVDERLNKYKEYVNVDLDEFKYYTYSWRIEEYVFNQLYTMDENEMDEYLEYMYKNLNKIIEQIFKNSKYKEMLTTLNNNDRKYIEERNSNFSSKRLKDFILKSRKTNDYFKLTPPIIYYGYKED